VGTVKSGDYSFSVRKEMKIIGWEQGFCTSQNTISSKRLKFVSDRVLFIVLRGRWCNIIVLNLQAPSEDKSDDSKDNFTRNWYTF
jgi:hypothetical protein